MTDNGNRLLHGLAAANAPPMKTHSGSDNTANDAETKAVSILFVDDDDFMREIVVDILSGLGYKMLTASGGTAALQILENNCRIDIILTDLVMEDMNGLELAGKVRDLYPLLPIVFVSGSTTPAEVPSGQFPYRFIQKPFTIGDLQAHIEGALKQAPSPRVANG